ncbi:MAG: hypothetical protein CSA34_07485 [Desulfobulbus propionicus]|nr:MAG: hypothetical protein CSA34_07485 [Desulfobulbus propionicus]
MPGPLKITLELSTGLFVSSLALVQSDYLLFADIKVGQPAANGDRWHKRLSVAVSLFIGSGKLLW